MDRGFFTVGVYHPKRHKNIGTLWRAAWLYGASEIFTVGARYNHQASDTPHTPMVTPLHHYRDADDLVEHQPFATPLVGVELCDRAVPLSGFTHPRSAVYLLGAEDHGIPPAVLDRCHHIVQVECPRPVSHNVSAIGSIVLWHRHLQERQRAINDAIGELISCGA